MKRNQYSGGCACDSLKYGLRNPPLFVHACHCKNCQKKAGSAFGMTTIILAKDLELVSGALIKEPILNATHRFSHLCSSCRSHIYTSATNHPATALLDSGTFDDLRALTINAHIFTKYKHHWLHIPDNIPQFEEGYDRYAAWPPTSLERLSEAVSEALNPSTE